MNVLGFERRAKIINGYRMRAARFESQSSLPVSAACVVANLARQQLAEAFGSAITLRLVAPVLPGPQGWACIAEGALLYGVRGERADGAVVLRPDDAVALAGAALGERVVVSRPLSAFESEMIHRLAALLSGTLVSVCGERRGEDVTKMRDLAGFTTYFELLLEEPVEARVGIALSREPLAAVHPAIAPALLREVVLDLSVEAAHAVLPASRIAGLRAGQTVVFDSALGDAAIVRAGETIVARGECGELGSRRVVCVR